MSEITNDKLLQSIKEYFNEYFDDHEKKLKAIESKQNELLGIVSGYVTEQGDRWAMVKAFFEYVRKILDRFVKKFMLFRDDVSVKGKPEVE